eukprot:CAMPEP_0204272832 /NCGR_PEP_ID=MMETSP0468-20130131/22305_1 /ASSEMBLY_ACC=CAM_ASM_000383 /TAXON_ID=2969 /ORGANISM="Oxyrrhis marina" /LENGTH=152 /DNA_ID=CAMNT_0051248719 /DNA_START=55 /DNA_END=513 /DNA_ORIENTATION=+
MASTTVSGTVASQSQGNINVVAEVKPSEMHVVSAENRAPAAVMPLTDLASKSELAPAAPADKSEKEVATPVRPATTPRRGLFSSARRLLGSLSCRSRSRGPARDDKTEEAAATPRRLFADAEASSLEVVKEGGAGAERSPQQHGEKEASPKR